MPFRQYRKGVMKGFDTNQQPRGFTSKTCCERRCTTGCRTST